LVKHPTNIGVGGILKVCIYTYMIFYQAVISDQL